MNLSNCIRKLQICTLGEYAQLFRIYVFFRNELQENCFGVLRRELDHIEADILKVRVSVVVFLFACCFVVNCRTCVQIKM